jgi:hypothetical protein
MRFHNIKKKYVRVRPMDDVRVALTTPAIIPRAPQKPSTSGNSLPWRNMFTLVFIASLCLMTTGYTISYFSDLNRSTGNSISAGKLDLVVSPDGTLDNHFSIEGGSNSLVTFTPTSSEGDFATEYSVSAEKVDGSDALCALVHAFSPTSTPFPFDASLLSLSTPLTTDFTPWSLLFTFSGDTTGIVGGESCSVDLVYKASVVGAAPGTGYQDEERVHLIFTADAAAPLELSSLRSFSAPSEIINDETEQNDDVPPPPPSNDEVPPLDEVVETPPPVVEPPPSTPAPNVPVEEVLVESPSPTPPPAEPVQEEVTPPVETPPEN